MPNFRRFLSRRWLLAFAFVLVLAGVPMLHPYPRQSLFGPTIRGKPWCVWEDAFRRHVHPEAYERTLSAKMLRWMGVKKQDLLAGFILWQDKFFDDPEALQLVLELADDNDPDIRAAAVDVLYHGEKLQKESALPVLRRRLNDDIPECRMQAAHVIWWIGKDKRLAPILLRELNRPLADYEGPWKQEVARGFAITLLAGIALESPEWFPEVAARATDSDPSMRVAVMEHMVGFGKKGVLVLIQGLDDKEERLQLWAISLLGSRGPDAAEAIPALVKCLPDSKLHDEAVDALQAIDYLRFHDLKRKNE